MPNSAHSSPSRFNQQHPAANSNSIDDDPPSQAAHFAIAHRISDATFPESDGESTASAGQNAVVPATFHEYSEVVGTVRRDSDSLGSDYQFASPTVGNSTRRRSRRGVRPESFEDGDLNDEFDMDSHARLANQTNEAGTVQSASGSGSSSDADDDDNSVQLRRERRRIR